MSAATDLPDTVVSTDWLASHCQNADVRVFDCTMHLVADTPDQAFQVVSGLADYQTGHIPGAAYLDLQNDLSDPQASLRFTACPPAEMAQQFARKGIADSSTVILYTRGSMQWATRIWWMLRSIGFDRAAVLNGGWRAWEQGGHPVSTTDEQYAQAVLTPRARDGLFVGREAVLAAVESKAPAIVNALGADNHSGQNARYGRAGRIPGSANVPASDLIDANGLLLDDTQLAKAFSGAGIDAKQPVIAYCGGGIAATLDAFALHRLGNSSIAVYDNSLNEWANDAALPMQTD